MKKISERLLRGFLFAAVMVVLSAPTVVRAIEISKQNLTGLVPKTILGESDYMIETAVAGDFNGDGTTDTAVCVPDYDKSFSLPSVNIDPKTKKPTKRTITTTINNAGAVFIFTSDIESDTVLSDAAIVIKGKIENTGTGYSCAVLDANGDGISDLLVGSKVVDNVDNVATHLILGSTTIASGNISDFLEYYIIDGASDIGNDVANAGDMNGDGFDDVLISSSNDDEVASRAGAAFLVLGSASPASTDLATAIKYTGATAYSNAGSSLASAGDVNNDGYDDILIGAPYDDEVASQAGAAFLVLGSASPTSSSLSMAIKYTGEASYDSAGRSVAGAGDVNGDGYDDMVIGVDMHGAYIILGSSSLTSANLSTTIKLTGDGYRASLPHSVAGVGDVNGDGYDDIVVGSAYNSDAGAAYLILGKASPISTTLTASRNIRKFIGKATSDAAGSFVGPASAGKFFIGAPGNDDNGTSTGKIWLLDNASLPGVNITDSSQSWIKTLP